MHLIYLERIAKTSNQSGSQLAGLPIDSNPVQAWKIGTDDVIVTTNDSIDIFRHVVEKVKDTNGNETKETKEVTKLIKSIKDYKLSKTQPKIGGVSKSMLTLNETIIDVKKG